MSWEKSPKTGVKVARARMLGWARLCMGLFLVCGEDFDDERAATLKGVDLLGGDVLEARAAA